MAGSRSGLHLRIFPFALHDTRSRPVRQDGLCLPQAPVATGRDRRGSRMRLGRSGAAHGSQLRRIRQGFQRFAGTDRLRARASPGRGAGRASPVHRRRLPQRVQQIRRLRLGGHAGAHRNSSITGNSAILSTGPSATAAAVFSIFWAGIIPPRSAAGSGNGFPAPSSPPYGKL